MCGIAGYLSAEQLPAHALERMTERLRHRAPDAGDYYRDGAMALGHRRLSVIDIKGSPQPMSTPDGGDLRFQRRDLQLRGLAPQPRCARARVPHERRHRSAALRMA